MTLERMLAAVTVLLGFYAGWQSYGMLSFFEVPGLVSYVVPDLVIAVAGVIGGVLLWRGLWSGHLAASIAWATALATGVTLSVGQTDLGLFVPVKAIISIPILLILFVAIRNKQRRERT